MGKAFKLGFVIGRFQHLTRGHLRMINAGLSACEHLLLLVGSSQEVVTERNPYSLKTRLDVIREVFPVHIQEEKLLLGHIDDMTNENDVCFEWGDYVLGRVDMWRQHYSLEYKIDCMIYGNDEERLGWYRPESVEGVSQIILSRPEVDVSATKVRKFLAEHKLGDWQDNVPYAISNRQWFNRLQEELLYVPHYKEMVDSE